VSVVAFAAVLLSVIGVVASQVWLKHAMNCTNLDPVPRTRMMLYFTSAIAAMALSFFISIALYQKFDLSYMFPFQGLNVVIVSLAAFFFLKEKFTAQIIAGILLISVGVALVCAS
jgi:drug/metabolite transporter (DMT)-like permease